MHNNKRMMIVAGIAAALAFSVATPARSSEVTTPTKAAQSAPLSPEAREMRRRTRWRAAHRSNKKPWTCTAIEKRKARKRRNVIRHRSRA